MDNTTSAINVLVDSKDKELATNILKDLGLNMSTFINMAVKQVIKRNGIPFEVINNSKSSRELLEALKEGALIEKEIKEGKWAGYSTINEMMDSILND